MKTPDSILLLVLGFIVWILGSVYYAYRGPSVLETTSLRYWISFFISPFLSAVLCIAILKLRHVPPTAWASGMLLLAIPGMIGEAVVLSHLSTFMPRIHASSGGRYGAFLFATYALVLGIAEVVTLRATGNALAELKTTTQRIASSQVTGNPEVSFITINVVKFSR